LDVAKGSDTRDRILNIAFRLAAREGLEGLSLGMLAGEIGLSKSGLFAHFKSKEELQIEMLRTGAARFAAAVLIPAFREPRGVPRIRRAFENWMRWTLSPELPGGCLMMAASIELDDHEGPVRDVLVELQQQLLSALERSAQLAVEAGHFRKGFDDEQFAFEMYSILLGFNHSRRLLRDPKAEKRARTAFARLLESAAARD
jgi:AcrR family transcriptional regulator